MNYDIDPKDAIAIVEALASGEITPERAQKAAIAVAKPKGPWPMVLQNMDIRTYGSPPRGLVFSNSDVDRFYLSNTNMDRLVVAWSQHRGVDLHRLCQLGRWGCDSELTARYDCCEQCDLSHIAHAIQPILDNAGASE